MAKSKNRPHRCTTTDDLDRLLGPERDPEGMLVRGHLLVERELVAFLAVRLQSGVTDIPERISFDLLVRLTFIGAEMDAQRAALLALNTARNRIAHSIDYTADDALQHLKPILATFRERNPELISEEPADVATHVRAAVVGAMTLIIDAQIAFLQKQQSLLYDVTELRDALTAIRADIPELQRPQDEPR